MFMLISSLGVGKIWDLTFMSAYRSLSSAAIEPSTIMLTSFLARPLVKKLHSGKDKEVVHSAKG
jgi:hypothetical protein